MSHAPARIPVGTIPRRIVFGATGLPAGCYAASVGVAESNDVWGLHIPVVIQPYRDPATAEHTVWVGPSPEDELSSRNSAPNRCSNRIFTLHIKY